MLIVKNNNSTRSLQCVLNQGPTTSRNGSLGPTKLDFLRFPRPQDRLYLLYRARDYFYWARAGEPYPLAEGRLIPKWSIERQNRKTLILAFLATKMAWKWSLLTLVFHDLSGVVGAHFGPKIFWSKFCQNRHFVGTIPPLLEGVRMNAGMEK